MKTCLLELNKNSEHERLQCFIWSRLVCCCCSESVFIWCKCVSFYHQSDILTKHCYVSIAEFQFDIDVNGISPSVVLFACVLSFDTMSRVLQNVFKQRAKTELKAHSHVRWPLALLCSLYFLSLGVQEPDSVSTLILILTINSWLQQNVCQKKCRLQKCRFGFSCVLWNVWLRRALRFPPLE